ncbi:MAG: putative Ig domain-containing protein [Phreatobacter sp.]|nr:putative Ig domain-containing protein [Phreatobacter sp.]
MLVGQPVAINTVARGGTGSVTYTLVDASGPLEGLGLTFENGSVSGTLSAAGTVTFRIRGTDSLGATGTTAEVTVTANTPTIAYSGSYEVMEGQSYTIAAPASNMTGARFAILSGPAGAAINPVTGQILGNTTDVTETTNLTFNVEARVGAISATGSVAVTVTAGSATSSVSPAQVLTRQPVSGSSSTTLINATWSLEGAPSGITIDPTSGAISGAPTVPGNYVMTAVARTSSGAIARSADMPLEVRLANIEVSASPTQLSVFSGQTVSFTASAIDASGPVTYSVVPETGESPLAIGLTLSGNVLSGPANGQGVITFRLRGTDSLGATGESEIITLSRVAPALSFDESQRNQTVMEGSSFSISGPSANIPSPVFTLGGNPPAWASINPETGTVSGTAGNVDATTAYSFEIRATNGPISAAVPIVLTVTAASAAVNNLPAGVIVGSAFSASATTTLSGATWSLRNAPSWMTIDPVTGEISGIASSGDVSNIIARATLGAAIAEAAPFTVRPDAATAEISGFNPAPYVYSPFVAQAISNIPGATFQLNNAPAWMSINAQSGLITGTVPDDIPVGGITVTASAQGSSATSAPITISPRYNLSIVVTGNPDAGFVSVPYSFAPTITGAIGDVSVRIETGTLPPGLILDTRTGALSGTPTAAGNYQVTLSFRDTIGPRLATFSINIAAVTASFANLRTVIRSGATYSGEVTSNLGGGTYALVSGPSGLTVSSSGIISGTAPTFSTTSSANVTVRYTNGSITQDVTATLSLRPALSLSVAGERLIVHQGQTLSITPTLSGDPATPATYAISPAVMIGYAFNTETGRIQATPTSATTQSTTITATDAAGYTASVTFTYGAVSALAVTGGLSGAVSIEQNANASLPSASVANALSAATWSLVDRTTLAPVDISASCPGLSASNGTIVGTPTSVCSVGSSTAPLAFRAVTAESSAVGLGFWLSVVPAVVPQTLTYTSGTGTFTLPAYNTLRIEVIGGGGGGGLPTRFGPGQSYEGIGLSGGASSVRRNDTNQTISATGGQGGNKSFNTSAGIAAGQNGFNQIPFTGGTATNIVNQTSGPGLRGNSYDPAVHTFGGALTALGYSRSQTNVIAGQGTGGSPVFSARGNGVGFGTGGAGRCASGSGYSQTGVTFICASGGSSGGYASYEWTRSATGAPAPGVILNWTVGAGGQGGPDCCSPANYQGSTGAGGMVRITIQ